MVSIADLDANHSLLGIRREAAHAVAPVAAGATQSVFHGRTVLHTWHFFLKPAQAKGPLHVPELSMYHRIDVGFVKRNDVLLEIADRLVILAVRFRLIAANPHQCPVAS